MTERINIADAPAATFPEFVRRVAALAVADFELGLQSTATRNGREILGLVNAMPYRVAHVAFTELVYAETKQALRAAATMRDVG